MAAVARSRSGSRPRKIATLKWLDAAYGQVPLPISVTHERQLVWVNPEFEHFYGCKLKAVRGKEMKDVVVTKDQLRSQVVDIQRLNESLQRNGLGIRHFLNVSHGRNVGVLVLAFSVWERNREFRVGIAIPDGFNDLLRLLARHVVRPEFDAEAFVDMLNENQARILANLSDPRVTPKAAGEGRNKNGAQELVRTLGRRLEKKGWIEPNSFCIDHLTLLARALGPLLKNEPGSGKRNSRAGTSAKGRQGGPSRRRRTRNGISPTPRSQARDARR